MPANTSSPFSKCLAPTHVFGSLQITRIKEKVEEQSGVPPPQQRLIFAGRQMYVDHHGIVRFSLFFDLPFPPACAYHRPDEKTAREFNITAGAVLHLVLALRGGS